MYVIKKKSLSLRIEKKVVYVHGLKVIPQIKKIIFPFKLAGMFSCNKKAKYPEIYFKSTILPGSFVSLFYYNKIDSSSI